MKKTVGILLVLLCTASVFAQKRTYLGFEYGQSIRNSIGVFDPDMTLQHFSLSDNTWGFTLRQELSNQVSIETGLIRKEYMDIFFFKDLDFINGQDNLTSILTSQIPIRLKTKINIKKDVLSLNPFIGMRICLLDNPGETITLADSGLVTTANTDTYEYKSTTSVDKEKASLLLEMGFSLEYELKCGLVISLALNCIGATSSDLTNEEIIYGFKNKPKSTASVFTSGGYFGFTGGVQYPISKLWQKKNPIKD